MFDYKYGSPTLKFRYRIEDMLPRIQILQNSTTNVLSLVMRHLSCFEIIDLSIINKTWYSATWDGALWRDLSKSLGELEAITLIHSSIEKKVKSFESSVQSRVDDSETFQKLMTCIKWKLVSLTYIYSFCSNCMASEGKLRFLQILKKTLCSNCSKDPQFQMISLENAECEFGVTRTEIESKQLDGLRVPHTINSQNFMFVYYLNDILQICKEKNLVKFKQMHPRTCIEERKRTEIVWHLRQLEIPFDFIERYLSTEGTLAHNYMIGRSRMTPERVAKVLAKNFHDDNGKGGRTVEIKQRSESPKVVKKIKLSEDDRNTRKKELLDRLTMMGLDSKKIDFNDTSGLAYSYVVGRTSKELGVVAGAIWRDFKPIFTGITGKTTQRIKDLDIEKELDESR